MLYHFIASKNNVGNNIKKKKLSCLEQIRPTISRKERVVLNFVLIGDPGETNLIIKLDLPANIHRPIIQNSRIHLILYFNPSSLTQIKAYSFSVSYSAAFLNSH